MEHRKFLWLTVRMLAAAGVIWVVYAVFSSLFPKAPSWPPEDEKEEEKAIAAYKEQLAIPDNPFSSRKPEDIPVYLSRIIDYDVKKGNLKEARGYIAQAINQKLDGQVESLATAEAAKELIAKVRSATKKQDDLNAIVARYEKRPGADAAKEDRDKFDREFKDLADQFCRTPCDAKSCPEQADEIVKTYKARLEPHRQDPLLKEIAADIEKMTK
jgi:hypothetical protein